MLSTPGRAPGGHRPSNTCCGCADALVPHRCPQAVHGRRGGLPGSAPASPPIRISAGRRAIRAAGRTIRRSVDRRGRPTRRDPDVRRGATATLTAPSTARQRSRCRSGESAPACRPGLRRRRVDHGRSACARPPATAVPRLCWLESVDGSGRHPACAACSCRSGSGANPNRSDQLPGRRDAARRRPSLSPRARPPTGGCAPSMSCSGSTS
jgi:hypothetical protein